MYSSFVVFKQMTAYEMRISDWSTDVCSSDLHLHYGAVQLTRQTNKDEVLAAFRSSPRIALIRMADGLTAINTVKELMADLDRPHDNLYEVALWSDMLKVEGDELFYGYMVDNQEIVIPETVDAIRARIGHVQIGKA